MNRRHFVAAMLGAAASPALARGENGGAQESQRLAALFASADEADLAQHPLIGLMRGDQRFVGRVGENVSPRYFAAERARCDANLAALADIDRSALSPLERLMADVFVHDNRAARGTVAAGVEIAAAVSRVNHFDSLISLMPDLASGGSMTRFETPADYEAGLARMRDFRTYLELCRQTLVRGLAAGITQPKIIVRQTSYLLGLMIDAPLETSPYLTPVKAFPDTVPASLRDGLARAYRAELTERLLPTYAAFRRYLDEAYLPVARESNGLSDMPGGEELYGALIREQTTTEIPPTEIHDTGLRLVADYLSQMDAVRRAVGFDGDLKGFFDHVRRAPELKYTCREAMLAAYRSVEAKIARALPDLFGTTPKSPFEIRLVPDYLEQTQAAGYYQPASADGTRPGIFFVNAYDLPSRLTTDRETLFLHEAIPGHHFQTSLAQENRALPNFQRFSLNNAYVEGWALYTETLGPELGLFTDPYQRLGHLDAMMLRAMRLVVDTGLHAFGWSRQRAIDYLMANSSIGETDARIEIDRYIAIPGQALGYMIGNLKIRACREKAAAAMGAAFDVRGFHNIVLRTGPLPFDVLEAEVMRWATARGS